ncbi:MULTISPECIES: excalibur calcium-binding domain-containing protein [unclassified Psychrobacter]
MYDAQRQYRLSVIFKVRLHTKMDGNHDGVPCEQQWCN